MKKNEIEKRMEAAIRGMTVEEAFKAGISLAVSVHFDMSMRDGLCSSYEEKEGERLAAAVYSVFVEHTQELRAKQAMNN
jgi:hypothetical protein